jgi:hypothetical protein
VTRGYTHNGREELDYCRGGYQGRLTFIHISFPSAQLHHQRAWRVGELVHAVADLARPPRPTSTTVIHIAFLHDATFHRQAVPRDDARYVFVDGLLVLFRPGKSALGFRGGAEKVRRRIERVVKGMAPEGDGGVVLVLENLDVVLAAGGVAAMELMTEILEWHQVSATPSQPFPFAPLLLPPRVC